MKKAIKQYRLICANNTKMDPSEIGGGCKDLINLIQDED
jgi:hypothetical protein